MDIIKKISGELQIRQEQTVAAVKLIDEGCTIPFIARYRKEATGSLNDEQLRNLGERLAYLRNLEERRKSVRGNIEEQGKLTPELDRAIAAAETMVALEDLYLPYRQKRRTRASIAKERGLEPLADRILAQAADFRPEKEAEAFVNPEKDVADAPSALAGASDILAERFSEEAEVRAEIRSKTRNSGILSVSAKKPEEKSVYEMYYDFQEPVRKIAGYRVLAINRGEKEKILNVRLEEPEEEIFRYMQRRFITGDNPEAAELLGEAIRDSCSRLLAPAIEREIRKELTERAEEGAMKVFAKNLQQLLMQPPIAGQVVLGWDPAFRTGCKLAVVDATGKVLDTAVIYPTAPTNPAKIAAAKETLKRLIRRYQVTLISVGNGTASRESEQFIVEFLKEIPEKISYVITNEAGASVYSASSLATEEFPEFDVGQRSAASIARRVQDPLAELVKIDPKSIGVGQYQHDMNQKRLGEVLGGVVESCVNRVGVDLNTASAPLLEYVSGISGTTAKNIVKYREENGSFRSRKELLKVPKLGPKAFEQCAGFLRIRGGTNPLDATAVHPESYGAAEAFLKKAGLTPADIADGGHGTRIRDCMTAGAHSRAEAQQNISRFLKQTAGELDIGELTLRDIISEMIRPGRDPREDMPKPVLRNDVLEMKDLRPGMILKGTVRNVIDFGAFVDIGVHQDGLVHISQMTDKKFVRHPLEVVSVGDVVEVKVLSVDMEKKRIALSMNL